ncbi:hypothetical protein BDQ12DRAFT_671279 [Crucibulum laeve]|uniref:Uncharacterized protein n=1 Tax=Crucibulum laeve TaxID=68775 RepID=A0A5C3LJU8_9AGAR|nr:hypothetical protein BDQ12DRAFT_671279 [Crucibulum laeve]
MLTTPPVITHVERAINIDSTIKLSSSNPLLYSPGILPEHRSLSSLRAILDFENFESIAVVDEGSHNPTQAPPPSLKITRTHRPKRVNGRNQWCFYFTISREEDRTIIQKLEGFWKRWKWVMGRDV